MIHPGDCLTVLLTLPAESVQCVVTSPPYWGLRDYGTASWGGGNPDCDHKQESPTEPRYHYDTGGNKGLAAWSTRDVTVRAGGACRKCGATRVDSQLGLEPTPEEYVANMVEVFREVRRVLRSDGTLWLNMGDGYARDPGKGVKFEAKSDATYLTNQQAVEENRGPEVPLGLKPKDMIGMPWMLAFALRADGWYLRSDIIWAKPNPMPESVTDRPTKAHEYLFLLTRSARYYYDADAIRSPYAAETKALSFATMDFSRRDRYKTPDGWDTAQGAHGTIHRNGRDKGATVREKAAAAAAADGSSTTRRREGLNANWNEAQANGAGIGANARTVWTIATTPYPEAHFATFPEALVEPCIKAGTRPGDVVLDPFAGSGTTLAVAKRLGRDGVGIELKPEYIALAEKRIAYAIHEPELFDG